MRRALGLFFVAVFVFLTLHASHASAKRYGRGDLSPDPRKYASLVVDADNGIILHQENADKPRYPASLTKLMTLYLTFEALRDNHLKLNQYLQVSAQAAAQPRLNLDLRKGEKITVSDAIYALVVHSANDAAVVLAEAVGGTERNFAKKMTAKARQIGMEHTTFKNASGLHNKEQITTAKDLAKLLIALKRYFPEYYSLLSKTKFYRNGSSYRTHNQLLKIYDGAQAGKTGYISASGFNLATQAKRNDNNLVGVVMGGRTSKSRDKIMVRLLDNGFKKIGNKSETLKRFASSVPVPQMKPWAGGTAVSSKKHDQWTLKMGDFPREEDAIGEVEVAMDIAPEYLGNSPVNLSYEKKLHSARFLNLTEQKAKMACNKLLSANKDCVVGN